MTDDIKHDLHQHLQSSIMDALMLISSKDDDVTASTITNESVNSMSTNSSTNTIMTLIRKLEEKVDRLGTQTVTQTTTTNNRKYTASTDLFNPRTGKPWKRYCWTHGCTTHNGRNCPDPKPGHIATATFKNRQN